MRRWTFTGWALAISGAFAALLVGVIIHFQTRVEAARSAFTKAKSDYELVTRMRAQYRELEVRKSRMPPAADAGQVPQSWVTFLSQKAREADLPDMSIVTELTSTGPHGEKEFPFTIKFDASANQTISRAKFVKFLDLVESQRPGFKSKHVELKFAPGSPDDCSRVVATFSHFERK